MNKTVISQSD